MSNYTDFPSRFVKKFLIEKDIGMQGMVSIVGLRTATINNGDFLALLCNRLVDSGFMSGGESVHASVSFFEYKYGSAETKNIRITKDNFSLAGGLVFAVRAGQHFITMVLQPGTSGITRQEVYYDIENYEDGEKRVSFTFYESEIEETSLESVHHRLVDALTGQFMFQKDA